MPVASRYSGHQESASRLSMPRSGASELGVEVLRAASCCVCALRTPFGVVNDLCTEYCKSCADSLRANAFAFLLQCRQKCPGGL